MLKSISNLGNVLSKSDQKKVNGGAKDCPEGSVFRCYYQLINGVLKTTFCSCVPLAIGVNPELDG